MRKSPGQTCLAPGKHKLALLLILLLLLTACAEASTPAPRLTPTPEPTPTRRRPTPTPAAAAAAPTVTPVSACPLPNMVSGQHLAASGSYTETETMAAGPMLCQIEPDSCAYHHLIGNLAPSIVFKREEEPPYDEEDILMHPDMLLPLTRLNQLVLDEWKGAYFLRITDAYDSLLEHDLGQANNERKRSLHFEGRSVDLTTWPIDLNQYGRLCTLAHCAGFAWVQHEGDHCHASINAQSLCLRCGN